MTEKQTTALSVRVYTPLAEIERMGKHVFESGLFGAKSVSQAVALLMLADAEGVHPMVAARDYHIIDGKPSKKARAMLADFLAAGGRVEWHERSEKIAEATFSHPAGGSVRIRWTIDMAAKIKDKSGKALTEKANYLNYPRAMLSARVISEGVITVFPGATSGLYTPEEVQDFDSPRPERNVTPATDRPALNEPKAKSAATDPGPDEPKTKAEPKAKEPKTDEEKFVQRFWIKVRESGKTEDQVRAQLKAYGVDHTADVPPEFYNELLAWADMRG
jgi:hypothetical protein